MVLFRLPRAAAERHHGDHRRDADHDSAGETSAACWRGGLRATAKVSKIACQFSAATAAAAAAITPPPPDLPMPPGSAHALAHVGFRCGELLEPATPTAPPAHLPARLRSLGPIEIAEAERTAAARCRAQSSRTPSSAVHAAAPPPAPPPRPPPNPPAPCRPAAHTAAAQRAGAEPARSRCLHHAATRSRDPQRGSPADASLALARNPHSAQGKERAPAPAQIAYGVDRHRQHVARRSIMSETSPFIPGSSKPRSLGSEISTENSSPTA
jgi:hypothetical protein